MNVKLILILVIALLLLSYAFMQERPDGNHALQMAHGGAASLNSPTPHPVTNCVRLGAATMHDGFRGDAYWRPKVTVAGELVCIQSSRTSEFAATKAASAE